MSRKNNLPQPSKAKKAGFFGDEDSEEPSMYFNSSNIFRSDSKEMMTSASPSQLSAAFASGLYGPPINPPSVSGMSNIALQQRSMANMSNMTSNMSTNMSTNMSSMGTSNISSMGTNLSSIGSSNMSNMGSSNLSSIGSTNMSNMGSINMTSNMSSSFQQQRNSARTGRITPTSIANFSMGLQQQQASPTSMRNLFRANPITSSIMSSQMNLSTSTGLNLNTSSGLAQFTRLQNDSQPHLDLSEFPTLGNRSVAPPVNPVPTARNYGLAVGMVNKQNSDPAPEFQIQQEEFPALPSAQNPPTSTANDNSRKQFVVFQSSSPGLGSYDQALRQDGAKFPGDKSATSQQRRGIQTHPDGMVSNIPQGMVMDQFGMVGLLTFIRAAETDANLVALAPGIDLTTLGLNLNSPENLYTNFQSPWADQPCRPQDIDFHVPQEYLTNMYIRDKLAPIKLNRYGDDLLFFLFYMNGGDVLQLAAAAELYNRDWRYHKEDRVWITRVPGLEPQMKTNSFERGTYYYFDAQNWRKVAKEFRLDYDKLEERPHLPPTLHHNPNQPAAPPTPSQPPTQQQQQPPVPQQQMQAPVMAH